MAGIARLREANRIRSKRAYRAHGLRIYWLELGEIEADMPFCTAHVRL